VVYPISTAAAGGLYGGGHRRGRLCKFPKIQKDHFEKSAKNKKGEFAKIC
jgi:hypothetical protein